jgi:hypothetical protein
MQKLGKLFSEPRSRIEEELRSCVDEKDIPQVLDSKSSGMNQELEVESEKESEEEQEVEIEIKEVRMKGVANKYLYKALADKASQLFSRHFNPIKRILPRGLELWDSNRLEYSPNLFAGNETIGTNKHALQRLPECFLLAINTPKEKRYVLVSLEDASRIKKLMHDVKEPNSLVLYSLDAKPRLYSGSEEPPKDVDVLRMAVQAKLCMGKIAFSKEEIRTLNELISAQRNPKAYAKRLKSMLENTIQYLPRTKRAYPGSAIQQLLLSYL